LGQTLCSHQTFWFPDNLLEDEMIEFEVVAEAGIRLDRRYAKGETLKLTPRQAEYLVLNGKIALVDANASAPTNEETVSTRENSE
jgi:hypothetical protein